MDAGGLIQWLQNESGEQPARPAPLIEVNVDTVNALMDRLGVEGARVENGWKIAPLEGRKIFHPIAQAEVSS